MPRDARDTLSLRTEFVLLASQNGANIRELYRRYGISSATAYKWLRRSAEEGPPGLQNRSRMPAFSSVHNLMARHGLLPGLAPRIPATGRFEHAAPNPLWQMDFKGHFPFGGGRCPAGRSFPVLAVPCALC